MDIAVQTDNIRTLREALKSHCTSVRFGSEFCEHLLPNLGVLGEAYELTREAGKAFTFVTPRLSNIGIHKLEEHLPFLSEEGEVSVVVNDFGAFDLLRDYPNLHPHLGRHLFMVPARSPWVERHLSRKGLPPQREEWIRALFASTSLNYLPTIRLYRRHGCQRADIDWAPQAFPSFRSLVEEGLRLSVLLHLVPATFTPRCHTARFLGEESPERCSRPCQSRAFLLRNEVLDSVGVRLYLHGNAVFRFVEPSKEGVADLRQLGVAELVLTMNPLVSISNAEKINSLISDLSL